MIDNDYIFSSVLLYGNQWYIDYYMENERKISCEYLQEEYEEIKTFAEECRKLVTQEGLLTESLPNLLQELSEKREKIQDDVNRFRDFVRLRFPAIEETITGYGKPEQLNDIFGRSKHLSTIPLNNGDFASLTNDEIIVWGRGDDRNELIDFLEKINDRNQKMFPLPNGEFLVLGEQRIVFFERGEDGFHRQEPVSFPVLADDVSVISNTEIIVLDRFKNRAGYLFKKDSGGWKRDRKFDLPYRFSGGPEVLSDGSIVGVVADFLGEKSHLVHYERQDDGEYAVHGESMEYPRKHQHMIIDGLLHDGFIIRGENELVQFERDENGKWVIVGEIHMAEKLTPSQRIEPMRGGHIIKYTSLDNTIVMYKKNGKEYKEETYEIQGKIGKIIPHEDGGCIVASFGQNKIFLNRISGQVDGEIKQMLNYFVPLESSHNLIGVDVVYDARGNLVVSCKVDFLGAFYTEPPIIFSPN